MRKHSTHLFNLKGKGTKCLWGWIASWCYFHLWHLCKHKLRKWCSPLSLVLRLWLITEFWVTAMNILPGSVSWVQLLFFNVFQHGKLGHIILLQGRKRLQMFFFFFLGYLGTTSFVWQRARDTKIDPNLSVRLLMSFKSVLSWCETKACFFLDYPISCQHSSIILSNINSCIILIALCSMKWEQFPPFIVYCPSVCPLAKKTHLQGFFFFYSKCN